MCDSIPVRLIFASTDPGIYVDSYKWNGQMYVSVDCNENSKPNFSQLTTSPFTWNFCNSSNCKLEDQILNITFTFNPNSSSPNDFLKFVVDTRGYVVSRPVNKIKDNSGNIIDIDIESVSRYGEQYGPESLLEIWLARGSAKGVFLPSTIEKKGVLDWGSLIKTLGWGLLITVLIFGLIYLIIKLREKKFNFKNLWPFKKELISSQTSAIEIATQQPTSTILSQKMIL